MTDSTTPEARQTLRRVRAYVRTHQARMDYPAFVAQGLPLGDRKSTRLNSSHG